LLNHIKVPYVAHWSFGERLPILEEGTSDPLSIEYALETPAALVAHKLEYSSLLVSNRASYVQAAIRGPRSRVETPRDRYEFDVFVSYERDDRKFAIDLINELTSRGLRVWSAIPRLEHGADNTSLMSEALARSRNMVALVGSEPTKWIESEYRQFLARSLRNER
jgi:TIR domain